MIERLGRIEECQSSSNHEFAAMGERLARVEQSLINIDRQLVAMDDRAQSFRIEMDSFGRESRAEFATVHSEIRRLDQVTDLRERLASVEAKLSAHQG